jgi:hypothetical protein
VLRYDHEASRKGEHVSAAKKKQAEQEEQEEQLELPALLASMDLKIDATDRPPRKVAPKVPRKPSVFDDALRESADSSKWMRFEIPTKLVKSTRFELIRAARSLDIKVTTRTGPVEQSITDEEEKTAIYFQGTWKED